MFFSKKTIEKNELPATFAGLVEQLLTEKGFSYTFLKDNLIKIGIKGDRLSWQVYIRTDEERKLITINSVLPLCVEDAQKLNMVDLLNRVNYQILFGKWCLDNEDGEISHITTHLADPGHFTTKELDILFDTNFRSVDSIFPAIANVNFGNAAPVIAFNSIS